VAGKVKGSQRDGGFKGKSYSIFSRNGGFQAISHKVQEASITKSKGLTEKVGLITF